MEEYKEEYKVEELFAILKQDASWEEDEQTRIMLAEALKGIIVSL